MILELSVIIIAYLLGSISFAIIVSLIFSMEDPRTYGSGNPGATNILRSGKKLPAALTLSGDMFKGLLAVTLSTYIQNKYKLPIEIIPFSALAVLVGHMWPLFFAFKGGKGVATALGVLIAMNIQIAFIALIVWLVIILIFRISSLAALIGALSVPISAYYTYGVKNPYLLTYCIMVVLVIYRHKENIKKILILKEDKIGNNNE